MRPISTFPLAEQEAILKRPIMEQLVLLKSMPNQTIYDKLTDNYFHYDTVVKIPKFLRNLYKQVVEKSVGRRTHTFAEVLALFQQVMACDGWRCAHIGSTPTIEVKRENLIPILGGHMIARCELVKRLAKLLAPTSDCPVYHAAGDYVG
jgi:hypothetical protein